MFSFKKRNDITTSKRSGDVAGSGRKRILFVQYADPALYPPVERSSWLLADQGWDVHFLGIRASGAAAPLATTQDARISKRLLEHRGPGVKAALSYIRFYKTALSQIAAMKPDVVYCSDLLSYPVGLMAASVHRGTVPILHEHDPPPQVQTLPSAPLKWIRRWFARRAKFCVIPQDQRAEDFQRQTRSPHVLVAYNCPSLNEIPTFSPRERQANFTLWYHGSIGPGQLPMTVIRALRHLPGGVRFHFAGYETVTSRGYVEKLLEEARRLNVEQRVSYQGAISSRADLYAAAQQCDLGLCLFATRFRDPMVGASNKPFDYLACGLPLLINATPEWQDFYGAAGVARACDPAKEEDIAKAIRWFLDTPEAHPAMVRQGRDLVERSWNYEAQFAKVLDALEAA